MATKRKQRNGMVTRRSFIEMATGSALGVAALPALAADVRIAGPNQRLYLFQFWKAPTYEATQYLTWWTEVLRPTYQDWIGKGICSAVAQYVAPTPVRAEFSWTHLTVHQFTEDAQFADYQFNSLKIQKPIIDAYYKKHDLVWKKVGSALAVEKAHVLDSSPSLIVDKHEPQAVFVVTFYMIEPEWEAEKREGGDVTTRSRWYKEGMTGPTADYGPPPLLKGLTDWRTIDVIKYKNFAHMDGFHTMVGELVQKGKQNPPPVEPNKVFRGDWKPLRQAYLLQEFQAGGKKG